MLGGWGRVSMNPIFSSREGPRVTTKIIQAFFIIHPRKVKGNLVITGTF